MRISDWSSDVCSSDLEDAEAETILRGVIGVERDCVLFVLHLDAGRVVRTRDMQRPYVQDDHTQNHERQQIVQREEAVERGIVGHEAAEQPLADGFAHQRYRREEAGYHLRSEEHTSELQSLMRNSYAVFS